MRLTDEATTRDRGGLHPAGRGITNHPIDPSIATATTNGSARAENGGYYTTGSRLLSPFDHSNGRIATLIHRRALEHTYRMISN